MWLPAPPSLRTNNLPMDPYAGEVGTAGGDIFKINSPAGSLAGLQTTTSVLLDVIISSSHSQSSCRLPERALLKPDRGPLSHPLDKDGTTHITTRRDSLLARPGPRPEGSHCQTTVDITTTTRPTERTHGKASSSTAAAAAAGAGKKDSTHTDSQDKKECDKPKSSGEEKGKDDKSKDDRDHKNKSGSSSKSGSKSSSSSSSSGKNLWVSGLASSTRAQDLKSVFSKYGRVTSAKIVTNAKIPGAKCYGFVTMLSSEDAAKCISQLSHTELHGRMIQVEKAKGEPGGPTRNKPSSSSSSSSSSARKPSDSKKDPVGEKKKECEKKESEKKDTSGEKKGNVSEEKTGKEVERKRSHSKDPSRSGKDADRRPPRKSMERRLEHRSSSDRSYRQGRDVLSFKQIMEERERQRMRVKERMMREEERRRKEVEIRTERRQREEAERLQREREKLRMEREKIERQKQELLRLEREHQRLEREKLEREREELRRQQMRAVSVRRYEETRRSLKRPSDERDRRDFFDDRKRPALEGRSRFDSSPVPQRSARGMNEPVQRRYTEERNYDREPTRFDHNHGHDGGGASGRDDIRGATSGGVGGGNSRYEDRREVRDREERRPVDRSGPRDDRDHRGGLMASQTSRDRPRESRYGGSGGDSWRTGGSVNDNKSSFSGSSALLGGSVGGSGMTARGDSQGWRTSSSSDRWASSSGGGPSMPVRGSSSSSTLGSLGMMDFLRGNVSHPPQSSLSSMSMAMMSQNDRFQTSNFRKY
ncbi:hypothetical protein Pmani_031271 [Petrolisthes manimaculis]|uniref:RRM domain-containing protein n=1 Tax=Petrolisthes manimaculis TaxID=1843537 RepID=A0AAE1NVI1_9EUCA|nr:hypothetical protein Pmani_031271 [Petrolisthes manimaculis]